jgi:hypothetical protein
MPARLKRGHAQNGAQLTGPMAISPLFGIGNREKLRVLAPGGREWNGSSAAATWPT